MTLNRNTLFTALLGMSLSFGVAAAQADLDAAQQNQASPQVNEQALNKFKDAFAQVNDIRKSYSGKLKNLDNQKQARQLQQQAQQEMVGAVQGAGLSVKEYNRIFAAVQQSPELQQKVLGTR